MLQCTNSIRSKKKGYRNLINEPCVFGFSFEFLVRMLLILHATASKTHFWGGITSSNSCIVVS